MIVRHCCLERLSSKVLCVLLIQPPLTPVVFDESNFQGLRCEIRPLIDFTCPEIEVEKDFTMRSVEFALLHSGFDGDTSCELDLCFLWLATLHHRNLTALLYLSRFA